MSFDWKRLMTKGLWDETSPRFQTHELPLASRGFMTALAEAAVAAIVWVQALRTLGNTLRRMATPGNTIAGMKTPGNTRRGMPT